ncbi:5-formyltetrahydrofolate cyclo-ligase [Oceaniferula spumae]|uniref:5-formyltetrahydrofolate cyclo-ligase n=1 Tax=Oceaniferula spumae TaxID=2979115 RepID=A0AAT9FSP0_9BACT
MKDKRSLRQEMRSLLADVTMQSVTEASDSICMHICNHPELHAEASTITVFSARADEIKLTTLHSLLPSKKLLYPLCHPGGILSFHHVENPSELVPGMLGILEPVPEKHLKIAVEDIDLFLCPGLVFGRDGSRLGHGGGFYDRALAKKKHSAIVCGVGLEMQVRDSVPHEDYDVFLQYLVTETGLRSFGS